MSNVLGKDSNLNLNIFVCPVARSPPHLVIAQKSMGNTVSWLYNTVIIVTCLVMVSTECINFRETAWNQGTQEESGHVGSR